MEIAQGRPKKDAGVLAKKGRRSCSASLLYRIHPWPRPELVLKLSSEAVP